jgi:hypothetical protein
MGADTRSITEPAGALALAGLKQYILDNKLLGAKKRFAVVVSGANMNFGRLRFVAERAELGEGREVLLTVEIPERPGRWVAVLEVERGNREGCSRQTATHIKNILAARTLPCLDRRAAIDWGRARPNLEAEECRMKYAGIHVRQFASTHTLPSCSLSKHETRCTDDAYFHLALSSYITSSSRGR